MTFFNPQPLSSVIKNHLELELKSRISIRITNIQRRSNANEKTSELFWYKQ